VLTGRAASPDQAINEQQFISKADACAPADDPVSQAVLE
jgi:hypothetical protein